MTAPVRRSERESRPSQRLREIENLFDVPPPPPPNSMGEDSDDGNEVLTDQLEVAHERIQVLLQQLNAALDKQSHQTQPISLSSNHGKDINEPTT